MKTRTILLLTIFAGCGGSEVPSMSTDLGTDSDTGAAEADVGVTDVGRPDVAQVDVGETDAGASDGGVADAGDLTCDAPFVGCGGECVNLAADTRHCGRCGNTCGGAQVCWERACTAPPQTITATVERYTIEDGNRDCRLTLSGSEKLVVDENLDVYLGMVCEGVPHVVRSRDGGTSFGPLQPVTGLSGADDIALISAGAGVLHATATLDTDILIYARSLDGGETWTTRPVDLGPVSRWRFVPSQFVLVGDDLYVLSTVFPSESTTESRLWRSENRGASPFVQIFTSTEGIASVFGHDGALWMTERVFIPGNSRDEVYRSDDRGETFTFVRDAPSRPSENRLLYDGRVYIYGGHGTATPGFSHYGLTGGDVVPPTGATHSLTVIGHHDIAVTADATFYVGAGTTIPDTPGRRDYLWRWRPGQQHERLLDLGLSARGGGNPLRLPEMAIWAAPFGGAIMVAHGRNGDITFQVVRP